MPPSLGQTHGSLLRLYQLSPADSGEYVCRVEGGPVPLESSVLVTIEPAGSVPGKQPCWEGTGIILGWLPLREAPETTLPTVPP